MIRLIYLMLSRHQPYLDQAIDYSALSAKNNAPRWIRQLKAIGKWPAPSAPAARPATWIAAEHLGSGPAASASMLRASSGIVASLRLWAFTVT